MSFANLEYAGKKRQTRREKFLGEMQQGKRSANDTLAAAIALC